MRWYLNHSNNKSPVRNFKQNKYIIESRGYPASIVSQINEITVVLL